MRLPVKLNKRGWPSALGRCLRAEEDPRLLGTAGVTSVLAFSQSLSVLKFDTTFKTTCPGRHSATNRIIASLPRRVCPVILDIGASDGSTSLDLINELGIGFDRYFVTDFNVEALIGVDASGASFFRRSDGECILRATDRFLVYSDAAGAPRPLAWLAKYLLAGHHKVSEWRRVSLFQPELLRIAELDPRIVVCKHDMFDSWRQQRPTIIKIANVLNRSYFPDTEIIRALQNQHRTLDDDGYLVLVDNRKNGERSSIYRRALRGFQSCYKVGQGCDIDELVTGLEIE